MGDVELVLHILQSYDEISTVEVECSGFPFTLRGYMQTNEVQFNVTFQGGLDINFWDGAKYPGDEGANVYGECHIAGHSQYLGSNAAEMWAAILPVFRSVWEFTRAENWVHTVGDNIER